jgi:hypothetical protein
LRSFLGFATPVSFGFLSNSPSDGTSFRIERLHLTRVDRWGHVGGNPKVDVGLL